MVRSALSKVAWVGRTVSMVFGLALVIALVVGAAGAAFATNGNNFVLGVLNNSATAITRLTANVDGPAMQVVNRNAGTDDTALDLRVQVGEAPIRVNSSKAVANLNADKVDGRSFGCPGGTLFHEGVCIEVAKRPANAHADAHQNCIDEGRRLPGVEELLTLRNRSGHDFAGNTAEWTSEIECNGTNIGANLVAPDGSVRWASAGGSGVTNYRCVAPLA